MKGNYKLVACMVVFSLGLFVGPAHADLNDGLVAYYPFNGNANDESGNGNHGTVHGATLTEDRFGKIDSAYHFDGNSYIVVPSSPSLESPSDQYSVAVWANTEAWDGGLSSLVCKGVQGAQYRPQFSDNGRFLFHDGVDVFTSFFANVNTWYFFVEIWNDGNAQVYVNGTKIGEISGGIPVVRNSEPLEIGRDQPGALEFMIGAIDDIRIYNRVLSEAEIQELYRESSGGIRQVAIDIKPGSSSNTINPKSHGMIPVAILTTETFDATTVDPLSVEFGPSGATEAHGKGHIEDVDHDGEPDLMLHFRTQATGITCGDTSASLTGETFDHEPIEGTDSIKTVGCKK
jgi:hypothetical protein